MIENESQNNVILCGSISWLRKLQFLEDDAVDFLAGSLRERALRYGLDDRTWAQWQLTARREYGPDGIADTMLKLASMPDLTPEQIAAMRSQIAEQRREDARMLAAFELLDGDPML